jgi:superfamily II DNA or RNA helicase
MSVSITELKKWTTPRYFQEGESWFEAGKVEHYTEKNGEFEGRISIRDRSQICRFTLDQKSLPHNQCPCRVNRVEGMVCGHVIAIMLAWRAEHADPLEERKARIDRIMQIDPEGRQHTRRLGESGVDTQLQLSLRRNWTGELLKGQIHLIPGFELEGRVRRPDQLHPGQVLKLSESDQRMLALLEEINGNPLDPVFPVSVDDFAQIMDFRSPKPLRVLESPGPLQLHSESVLPLLTVDLDRKSGELLVTLKMDLPHPPPAGSSPLLVLAPRSGWVVSGLHAWPLEAIPPSELRGLCSGTVRIPRSRVMRFLKEDLPELENRLLVDNRVPEDAFTTTSVCPPFLLRLKGGLQFISGVLIARYGEVDVLAGGPDPDKVCSIPDPDQPLAYGGRNPEAEADALARLKKWGFAASSGDRLGIIEGQAPILNALSRVRFELEPLGWEVELNGNLEGIASKAGMLLARIEFHQADTPDWFQMNLTLRETGGEQLTEAALRKALDNGEEFIQIGDRFVLLPLAQTEALVDAVREAKPSADGSLQVPKRTCGYLNSILDEKTGIPVQRDESWIQEAASQNQELSLEPVNLAPALQKILRPYQETGVQWLRLLEKGNYGGILADDMGLGKTLQTLAWLSLPRIKSDCDGPALVVCPSSLVENWVEESNRFIPESQALAVQGTKRAELWTQVGNQDLVVISYALLRRDLKQAEAVDWSAVILDEAQHIKNPGTQNAQAAKKLRAGCRLVLSGTPMENQVRDLWSLMDFLMPGYLGSAADFKKRFSSVIESGGAGSATAIHLLRRKLKPFLLRRLKQEVAKDLPPRLERRVYCDLSPLQRQLYDEVNAQVKAEAEQGRSKLAVLQGLMRLRQICGHPSLITKAAAESGQSGKLDTFMELLDEIIDGGHRVLVFSQFTSMLAILKDTLDAKGVDYAYLDGSTQNRQSLVHDFNEREDLPVFLISLKAGGTGLNLTGADVVIHFDPWWNPAVEDQATDRAHRIGQEKTVYAMKLITRGTVEGKVARMQDEKRELIEAALEGDDVVMERLDWKDVRELLEL